MNKTELQNRETYLSKIAYGEDTVQSSEAGCDAHGTSLQGRSWEDVLYRTGRHSTVSLNKDPLLEKYESSRTIHNFGRALLESSNSLSNLPRLHRSNRLDAERLIHNKTQAGQRSHVLSKQNLKPAGSLALPEASMRDIARKIETYKKRNHELNMQMSKKFLSHLGATHNVVNIHPDGQNSKKILENPHLLKKHPGKNKTDMRRLLFCKDYMMRLYKEQVKELEGQGRSGSH